MQVFATRKTPVLGGVLNQLTSFTKIRKAVRIMKLIAILLLGGCLQLSARGIGQTITISVTDAPLEKVFQVIEKQTDFVFFVKTELLKTAKSVTMQVNNLPLQQVLDLCFKNQPLKYSINGKIITIAPKTLMVEGNSTGVNQGKPGDIKGRILDANGEPVSGATVSVKGGDKRTITNVNGEFTLSGVDDKAILIVSHVQYESISLNVNGKSFVNATLQIRVNSLDETIVIAYGTTTKRFNTGNIATVKGEDIQRQPISNPLLALQGRVPGLFITQNNGISGGGVTVRIQGQNSIRNGNDPLYVIDGVPYFSQLPATGVDVILGRSGQTGSGDINYRGNPLNYINPSDIESIEVLKDADATAIYGSRAANGAILITTKKGKAGPVKLDLNFQTGWGKVATNIDMLNTEQYIEMRREAYINDGLNIPVRSNNATSNYDLTFWDSTKYTDWQKELIGNTARYKSLSATLSGGNTNLQYLIGGTYHKETTVFPLPDEFANKKGAVHFNLNGLSTNQRFRLQFSGNYMIDNNQLPNQDLTTSAIKMEPNSPALYNSDGTLNWQPNASGTSTFLNPLNIIYSKYVNKSKNLLSNLILGYKLLKGLEVSGSFGYSNLQTNDFNPNPLLATRPESRSTTQRTAVYGYRSLNSWVFEPQLSYKVNIGRGKLESLLASTIQETNNNGNYLIGTGYNSDLVLEDIRAASSVTVGNSFITQYKHNAVFGRINYNWADKYIINLTARRDGSSRFGFENKFHNFGAVGAAWLFSNEIFAKKIPFLSFGKLKGSYGTTGSDQIPEYSFLNLYSQNSNVGVPYQGINGLRPNGLYNPYLQWEETKKMQLGLEIGLLKDRILLTATYAQNRSSNQLLDYILPSIVGFNNVALNFPANVQNINWEFTLNTTNITNRNLKWSTNFNLTIPKNKLLSFPNLETSSYANQLVTGQPVNIIWVYRSLGVDPTTGKYQVEDGNGNATTTFPSGIGNVYTSVFPEIYGGFQNNLTFKNFQIDFLFQFVKQIGINRMFDNGSAAPGRFLNRSSNQPVTVLQRWQKNGDITSIQRYSTSLSAGLVKSSDAFYTDASYVRLKNISASWQLPQKWGKISHTHNARVYIQGQNMLTFTNYKGLDPESQSVDALPPLKVWIIGLQVGF